MINLLDHINTNVKFIFSSSCTVYGQAEKLPITEKTPLKKPESPYGNTKKICENILEDKTKIEDDCLNLFFDKELKYEYQEENDDDFEW